MSAPASRRGFLRGLTTLPLIGGGVTLVGNPTGLAAAPSKDCLHSYLAFLHYEARAVHDHLWPNRREENGTYIPLDNAGGRFHFEDVGSKRDWPRVCQEAAFRAPVVLSAVGCDWRSEDLCA